MQNRSRRGISEWASRTCWIVCIVCLLLPANLDAQRTFRESHHFEMLEVRFSQTDHPDHALVEYDDSDWELKPYNYLPMNAGPYWLRAHVRTDEGPTVDGSPLGLLVKVVASYEVYWDGVLIAKSGTVGKDAATEDPGPLDNLIYIPSSLTEPGEHVIAIRMSSYHGGFPSEVYSLALYFDRYADLAVLPLRRVLAGYLSAAIFLLISLFFIAYYFASGRRPLHRTFSLLCVSAALFNVTYVWRTFPGYTYEFHYTNRILLYISSLMVCSLVVRLLLDWYGHPRKKMVWAVLTVLQTSTYLYSPFANLKIYFLLAVTCMLLAGIHAWTKQGWKQGILVSLITGLVPLSVPLWVSENLPVLLLWQGGIFMAYVVVAFLLMWQAERGKMLPTLAIPTAVLLVLLIISPGSIEQSINLIVTLAVFILFAGVLIDLRKTRQREAVSRLNAARLEAEMLRKQLQPHFLLNTLTSITEWIEEDPPTSVRFIEALADELRTLASFSNRNLVTMREELQLCRYHLQIMSYRKNRRYSLHTEGVDESRPVPPALIHTLVENAVTHYRGDEASIDIRLVESVVDKQVILTLSTPMGNRSPSGKDRQSEGGGIRYIKARLEEAFPGRWSCDASRDGNRWVTRIGLPKPGGMS